ncbi:FAD binding domain-containing protein [Phreatobacter sp. AB_2022a]|uniref:FAD binding domain-containing protein n=1 Tax=Phreatobacter sp. AB_2022a TaxID=3003134 RepID=UPI0022876E81|nr:FAD binding domain-containing protein [Phreatobacter sp. AB_2022a]MCZ0737628.1 FAD binding domain-containing protein [Phreatobacter sp. AB_2022a]
MRPFEFQRASSLAEALDLLARPNARALAGGTTLIDLMKLGVEAPATVIDIGGLPLDEVTLADGRLRLGGLASNSKVARDAIVRAQFPVISEAILAGASGQIRNAASMGGNLLQRTRCAFFRSHDWPCNKRAPGTGCPARDGANAHHAVLGTSDHCLAVHPSDLAVALLALDAVVALQSNAGMRRIPLASLYRLPGSTPDIETVVAAGELITHIDVPQTELAARSGYLKLRGRASYEFASASVAAAVRCEDGRVAEIAVALGGLGTVPWRDRSAEALLIGESLTDAAIDRFCTALLAPARPTEANAYKLDLARGAVRRALMRSASC